MPRKPRVYLPGLPCHSIQRGNNRNAAFFSDQDYLNYLACHEDAARHPAEYRWASYRTNATGEPGTLISPHGVYTRFGKCDESRQQGHRALFDSIIDPKDVERIRIAANCSMPLGDSRFKQQIEAVLSRKLGYCHRGRPRKRGKS